MMIVRRLLGILMVCMVIVLIIWSLHIHDPHLLSIRQYEFWIILGFALGLVLSAFLLHSVYLKAAICLGSSVAIFIAGTSIYSFNLIKAQLLYQPDDAVRKHNERFIVGFVDWDEITQLSRNGIAGIFLTSRNIKNLSADALKLKIDALQHARQKAKQPPLYIATDQEGGLVSRLTPLVERQPPLAALLNQPDYVERAYEYGDKQGKALASAGVNLNFSPVVDLKPITKPSKLDFHSHIATRAISTDPEQVIEVATPYIRGLRQQGVLATLKHFPGLAHVVNDTHHFSAFLEKPIKELEEGDFLPFLRISRGTDVWIMLSHVILVNVDATKPVSTSRQVIDILIRQQLGINNALITDDLTMGATYNRGFCKSVRQSYETSVNYLLIAYDYEKYYSAVSCLSKSFGREK